MSKLPDRWWDVSWNPISGCTPVSEGCVNCYARTTAEFRLRGRHGYDAEDPFRVTWHPDKLEKPREWKKPKRIFVCSMGDLFHQDVSLETIHTIWDEMKACAQHTFIVLTKRPTRMKEVLERVYSLERLGWSMGFWKHVWLGITAENQARADERIPVLLQIPAAVRFVSVEPMLGPIHLPMACWAQGWQRPCLDVQAKQLNSLGLDLVICGAETGRPKKDAGKLRKMDLGWARDLRDQCQVTKVPFWMKKTGPGKEPPEDLAIRQWPAMI